MELTTAGRALLDEAPLALAALERAAERTRLAGAGVAGTVRLAYTPAASFETLGAILAAVEDDSPTMTVVPSEVFSAEIPGRVLAGKVDVGLALRPEPMRGVRSERLRIEPLALLVGRRHRLADASIVALASLENETLLLFPRELAPAYYDRIIAAFEQAGVQPHVRAFPDPPPQAMIARLPAGREVNLAPASYARHARGGRPRHHRPQDRRARDPGGVVDPLAGSRAIRSDDTAPRQRATLRTREPLATASYETDCRRRPRHESSAAVSSHALAWRSCYYMGHSNLAMVHRYVKLLPPPEETDPAERLNAYLARRAAS